MTLSQTSIRRLFTLLASAALISACSAQDNSAAESRDDGAAGSAKQALGSVPNLALGRPASQSSTAHDGVASRAVDGNTSGNWHNASVTHTEDTFQPWWQVDLGGSHALSTVVVHNRTDCCSERLQNFRVRVSDDGVSWQDYPYAGIPPAQSTFTINRSARYVRVQLDGTAPLSLAEVQVFPAGSNLALGKPASQSSTAHDGVASRAVDGNTSGNWHNASVTHTEDTFQPWWQVDLGSAHALSTIVVHNRTDCCSERLQNFRVRVSDDGVSWQDYPYAGIPPAQSTFAINRSARYVRVQLDGTAPLSLAEVQVFTPSAPSPTEPLISVDTAGCNTNVAINNAIGQSFRVGATTGLETIEVWIKPNLYYTTSYALEVYEGEGTGGTKLATSQTTVTLGSLEGGTPSTFRGFSFAGQGLTLQPHQPYTFKLVRLSQYSGAFSKCDDVYPHGMEYWLGYSPDHYNDMSFKLYGSVAPLPPPPPTELLISVDTAGCNTNVAINNAIGQSFRVGATTGLETIEVWIKPNLYYTTSYALEVYEGEGTGGTKLATSQTTVTLGSQEDGTPSTFRGFSFTNQGLTLQPHQPYTFKLVRLSQYSGAFSRCDDVYPGGMEYWLGYSLDRYNDMSFKLYGS